MSENNINNNEKKAVPEFEKLEDILGCKNCKLDCHCNPNKCNFPDTPYSKNNCKRIGKNILIMEIIIGVIAEILIISLSYIIFHSIALSISLAVLAVAAMFYCDENFVDEIIRKKFASAETKRKEEYDAKVEEIKRHNEILERQERGETEEYLSFKNQVNEITEKLDERIESFSNDKFVDFVSSLKCLNSQITPANFEYLYIQTFYNIHLISLIQNIDTYLDKYFEGQTTIREIEAFENLIDSFDKRISQIIKSLREADEEEFIKKMNSLQEGIYNVATEKKEN